ncbi:FHA domain-containing protein [Roseimicrobium gellanilyticum]|uniref:FHA domain-containing protein n=1 Tax=Roseimicrobium gellanilyticum TaxID=748857 RepID=A0A366HH25_9BACT|nr:trypsin-like peptidase domain-containing protein [Roseimicrobium gellanilyticum]RBP41236.1 FHA domain-containing protein [Roseimicrobium gellanilyticum]
MTSFFACIKHHLVRLCVFGAVLGSSGCNQGNGLDTERVKDSCVRFLCVRTTAPAFERVGSGFIINDRGDVVTNNHVVAGADMIFILHKNKDRIRLHLAKSVKTLPEADLAVVSSGINASPLTLNLALPNPDISGNTIVSSVGFPAIADTRPIGLGKILLNKVTLPELKTKGVDITQDMEENQSLAQFAAPSVAPPGGVRRIARRALLQVDNKGQESDLEGRSVETVEFNVDIAPGNSGGPLLDRAGYVVGVVGQGRQQAVHQIQFAMSSKELAAFLSEHDVPFGQVNIVNPGQLTMLQKALIALASAALLVAAGLGLTLLTKRRPATMSMPTSIFRQKMEEFMNNGQGRPGNHQKPGGTNGDATALSNPSSGVVWELEITGEGGFRQRVSLTDEDFIKGRGRVILGRNADFSGVTVKHDSISRQHLHFELKSGSLFVADRNSSNGTKVNNIRLSAPFRDQALKEGDRMDFGQVTALLRRRF